eukprot:72805-Rhodomonas_salina.3
MTRLSPTPVQQMPSTERSVYCQALPGIDLEYPPTRALCDVRENYYSSAVTMPIDTSGCGTKTLDPRP